MVRPVSLLLLREVLHMEISGVNDLYIPHSMTHLAGDELETFNLHEEF